MFPVYVEIPTKEKGMGKYTKVKNISGDIWAFETDLRSYLEKRTLSKVHIQVLEYAMTVVTNGVHHREISDFLIEKGF